MKTSIEIPNKNKKSGSVPGLFLFCNYCKSQISEICKESGKNYYRCEHYPDKFVYRQRILIPGAAGKKIVKVLESRNLEEAVMESLQIRKQFAQNDFHTPAVAPKPKQMDSAAPLLVNMQAEYIAYLHGHNVPEHLRKVRTIKHIRDVERHFLYFVETLKTNGIDPLTFRIDQTDENIVGMIHNYIRNEKKFMNRTYNKFMGCMSTFYEWVSGKGITVSNPFRKIPRRKVITTVEAISEEEFKKLLEVITPENGIEIVKYFSTQKQKEQTERKFFYRPWLKNAFKLAIETGRRREEIAMMKFSNIEHDESGRPEIIVVEDFKVNRIQQWSEEERKFIYVPITQSLETLLNALGYNEHKNKNRYLIASDEKMSRNKVMDLMTRAFSHYYRKLNTGKNLSFKCLRKTYITRLSIFMGGNARIITRHSGDDVMHQHYIDNKEISRVARQFTLFNYA